MKDTKGLPDILHSETKVSYATLPIFLHQYIFGFDVSVGNGWLSLGPKDFSVEMTEATRCGVADTDHGVVIEGGLLEVVMEGALGVVVCDEQHLSQRTRPLDVSCDVTWRRKSRVN